MCCYAVIPKGHTSRRPLPAYGKIISGMEVLTQEIEDVNVLRPSEFRDLDYKGGIVEESLYMGDRVGADKRMGAADGGAERLRAAINGIDVAVLWSD